MKASDNAFPSLLITEGTEPSAPAAGKQRVYVDSTSHHLSRTDSSGVQRDLEGEFATANTKIATSETTASATFADLATPGPSVTVTVGPSGKVIAHLSCRMSNNGANQNFVGIDISGATTVAASSLLVHGTGTTTEQFGSTTLISGLNAGSTTFKMQYAVAAGTGTFLVRELTIVPVF